VGSIDRDMNILNTKELSIITATTESSSVGIHLKTLFFETSEKLKKV
jgi:hypothetical protein